jgi:cytochrome P450
VLLDMLFAGSETTSTALNWAIMFMIKYPDIQRRVQQELDQVVGRNRLPNIEDRYFFSFIYRELLCLK